MKEHFSSLSQWFFWYYIQHLSPGWHVRWSGLVWYWLFLLFWASTIKLYRISIINEKVISSCSRIVLAPLIDQMFFPAIHPSVDVKMAQGAAICSSHGFGWKALLLLNMCLVYLLLDCFLASWTLFIVFAIGALSHQMGGECTYFNALIALFADGKHRASIVVVHIFVVLFNKFFIMSFAKLAILFFILKLGWLFLRNFNKLVPNFQVHRFSSSGGRFTSSFAFDRFLIIIGIILSPSIIKFVLDRFDDRRSKIFSVLFQFGITYLSSYWAE